LFLKIFFLKYWRLFRGIWLTEGGTLQVWFILYRMLAVAGTLSIKARTVRLGIDDSIRNDGCK
jgi:hypothetical protein